MRTTLRDRGKPLPLTYRWWISRQLRRPSGWFGRHVIAPRFQRLNLRINQSTLDALDLAPDDSVLEVGFGPGDLMDSLLARVPEGFVTGADFSADMAALCRRRFSDDIARGRVRVEQADVMHLPFDDGSFTKACTVNTVYFWTDLVSAFGELGRVLVPGGRVAVSFSPRETMEPLGVDRSVFTLRDPDEVASALHAAGLGACDVTRGAGPSGEFVCLIAHKPVVGRPTRVSARQST